MVNTPEELAALNRLREMRRQSDEHDGGYPDTVEGRRQSLIDHAIVANIALRDYPADDDCDLSRQELIEELALAWSYFRSSF